MIKVILFDADGVVINKPKLFSQQFMADYGVSVDKLLPFFENEFQPCLVGKADLKTALEKYIGQWGWKKSIDDLLKYWFASENYSEVRLISDVGKYKALGIKCYLQTNQEKYRTEYMRNEMGLGRVFDGIFSSAYLGVKKPELAFWEAIAKEIQPVSKSSVLVWDDDQENIGSAKSFGFRAEFYKSYDSYNSRMMELLIR